jgi:hypothetical protein
MGEQAKWERRDAKRRKRRRLDMVVRGKSVKLIQQIIQRKAEQS